LGIFTWFSSFAEQVIPPSLAVPDNSVDKTQPGFLIRPYRTTEAQAGTLAWTQLQLAGFKGPNVAEVGDAQNGWFTNENTINYVSVPGASAGRFSTENGFPDAPFPGLAATPESAAVNLTEEILTWVEFPAAGQYTMGVRCKDGFKVTVGEDPRDQFAQVLGQADQLRPSEDTVFVLSVSQPGIYPLRLLWMNGVGAADLEWFTVQSNGTYTLLNDTTVPGALKTYRTGPQGPAYISTLSPNNNERDVQPGGCILVQVTDGATTFDAGSAMMTVELDGMGVGWGSSSKSGNLTTSSNFWPGLLAPGSTNQATLYTLEATGVRSRSWQFVMADYAAATPTVTTATNAVWLDANSSITVSYYVYAPGLPLPATAMAVSSSNPDLVPNSGLYLKVPGSEIPGGTTGQVDVVIAPSLNACGVTTLSFTVNDGQYFVQNLLTVNVRSNTNAPPLVTTTTNHVFVDENSVITINYEVTDPDSTLTVANFGAVSSNPAIVPNTSVNLSLASGIISAGTTNTVTLTVTPAPDAQGDVLLSFVVNDYFNTVTNIVNLTVRPVVHPFVRPTQGLLAWWPGDGDANDVLGSNNGRLNGGAGFAAGILGQAFDFNGTNDYLELPICLSTVSSAYSFTLEGWVYPTDDSGPEMSLAVCGDGSSPRHFKLDLAKSLSDEYSLRLLLLNPTNSVIDPGADLVPFVLQGTAPIPPDAWTHIAVTLDCSSGFSIYVNGDLDARDGTVHAT
jgi:hypothetical protein